MIELINGILLKKEPTKVIIDCNGVGYGINIPVSTYKNINDVGSKILLFCYQHVREDILQLYGFFRELERDLFLMIISVSKIGPKTGLAVLSTLSPEELVGHVKDNNIKEITRIPGIGTKAAERLVLELKGKINKLSEKYPEISGDIKESTVATSISQDAKAAVSALESLGYKRSYALKAVEKVEANSQEKLELEEIIKSALKYV